MLAFALAGKLPPLRSAVTLRGAVGWQTASRMTLKFAQSSGPWNRLAGGPSRRGRAPACTSASAGARPSPGSQRSSNRAIAGRRCFCGAKLPGKRDRERRQEPFALAEPGERVSLTQSPGGGNEGAGARTGTGATAPVRLVAEGIAPRKRGEAESGSPGLSQRVAHDSAWHAAPRVAPTRNSTCHELGARESEALEAFLAGALAGHACAARDAAPAERFDHSLAAFVGEERIYHPEPTFFHFAKLPAWSSIRGTIFPGWMRSRRRRQRSAPSSNG